MGWIHTYQRQIPVRFAGVEATQLLEYGKQVSLRFFWNSTLNQSHHFIFVGMYIRR